jgi:hypothetical protein
MPDPPQPAGSAQLRITAALDRLDFDEWEITPLTGATTYPRQWPDGLIDTGISTKRGNRSRGGIVMLANHNKYGNRP